MKVLQGREAAGVSMRSATDQAFWPGTRMLCPAGVAQDPQPPVGTWEPIRRWH